MSLTITDCCCDECGLPAELDSVTFWCSNGQHYAISLFRCVNGHEWEEEQEAEVVDE